MQKRVCILGTEYIDITLYLSRILHIMGKQVTIIDNSIEKKLRYCIPGDEMGLDQTDYLGVSFRQNVDWSRELNDCDVALYIFADMIQPKVLVEADIILVVVDQHKYSLSKTKELLFGLQKKVHLVIKNYVCSKIEKTTILFHLGLFENQLETLSIIPIDEETISVGITAEYNAKYRFDHISKNLRDVILEITAGIMGDTITEKVLMKAWKQAQRGE